MVTIITSPLNIIFLVFQLLLLINEIHGHSERPKNHSESKSQKHFRPKFLNKRIIGGQATWPQKYPWMVSLRKKDKHICGGSIISPSAILTSATCIMKFHDSPSEENIVIAGEFDLQETEKGEQQRQVDSWVVHEGFDLWDFSNNIGIIKVRPALDLNKWVKAADLPENTDFEHIGTATTIGWGSVKKEGDSASRYLKDITLPHVDGNVCEGFWGRYVTKGAVECYGGKKGESLCIGDNGSPLMHGKAHVVVSGLVSIGQCEEKVAIPDIFTNVAYHLPWIKKTLNDIGE